ncbi:MAG: hypothetical protein FWD39_02770, partial [Clostridiales bacterium]|nr:hypothetical protein [Clostridiales bacterium]
TPPCCLAAYKSLFGLPASKPAQHFDPASTLFNAYAAATRPMPAPCPRGKKKFWVGAFFGTLNKRRLSA